MFYLNLKTNSIDYHGGVQHCKKDFFKAMLRKNVKKMFFTILFKSITKATFNGVDNFS